MELTPKKLEQMAAADIRTANLSELTDLRDINIDTSWPIQRKLQAFADQTNNVYLNRIGDYIVKVSFQKSGATIDEKMSEYLHRLSEIYI
ncbi:MAG: hypothetical protein HFG64_09570 [Lachnospiraceae bacterium]|nr:hypothetical protein [Lachnospiraceae bacterium]